MHNGRTPTAEELLAPPNESSRPQATSTILRNRARQLRDTAQEALKAADCFDACAEAFEREPIPHAIESLIRCTKASLI